MFRALRTLATRLVTDSTRFPATLDAPAARSIAQDREVVTDLAWTKITGWREVVASIFDDPDHRDALGRLEHVAIDYVRGSDAQARLLGGWLVAGTGCDAVVTTRPVERADMRAGLAHRASQLERRRRGASPSIGPQEGMAVIDAPGRAARARVALRVPPFEVLIGEELEFLTNDHAFLGALAAAAERGGKLSTMPETMRFAVYPAPELAIRAAADLFTALAPQSVALAGGNTPKELYGLLASDDYRDRTDWHELEIYYGDERAVPPNHPDSNYGMSAPGAARPGADRAGQRVPDGGRRHRPRGGRRPLRAAAAAAPRPRAARDGRRRPHREPVPRRRRLRRAGAPRACRPPRRTARSG